MSLSLPQLAHRGVPVVLTSTLADAYEVKPINIQKNFTQNRDRFIEGKHYYTISGSDLKEFKNRLTESKSVQIGKNARTLTLWTERGAARHAKMLNSDKAWDMFELLEETFFSVKGSPAAPALSTVDDRRPLNNIVHLWAQKTNQKYSMCWRQVNSAFNLQKAAEFPASWIKDAIAWVQEKIDALPAPAQKALPGLSLDLTRTDPISLTELVDVLSSLEYRMERTCHTMSEAEWKAGAQRFYEAAGTDHQLTTMLSCTLVGPRFITLDLIKSAASMARKAQRMHELVCDCR